MKHLKRFDFVEELREFCEDRLVYLLDDGFEVSILEASERDDPGFYIRIFNNVQSEWSLIQDNFIPFLQIISRKYKILELSVFGTNQEICFSGRFNNRTQYYFYTSQEVLDEDSEQGFPNFVDRIILKVK